MVGEQTLRMVQSTHPNRLMSRQSNVGAPRRFATPRRELEDPLDHEFVEEFVRRTSPKSVPDDFVDLLVGESLKVPARVWRETPPWADRG